MKKVIDDVIFLKGRRLYMRPMTKADIPRYLRWRNDPEVRQYLGAYLPTTEPGLIKWMDSSEENKEKEVVLIIVEIKSAKPIGVG